MNPSAKDCEEEIVADKTGLEPTLLRFATPLLITEEQEMIDAVINKHRQPKVIVDDYLKPRSGNKKLLEAIERLKKHSKGTVIRQICTEDYNHPPNDTVVQKIHPPRTWERRGQKCTQKISIDCTIRSDVIALKKNFDERLKEFGLDQIGLCKHRRDYFDQLFDEIIRQVSMSCVERGQLLLTVRDEMNKMFSSYESLYCSAIAYGIKSQMRAQQNVESWREKIFEITEKINDLEIIQEEFVPAYTHFQQVFDNQLDIGNKDFIAEYDRLQRIHVQLKDLLLNAVKDPTSNTDVSTTAVVNNLP